jgi:hypothetical protein
MGGRDARIGFLPLESTLSKIKGGTTGILASGKDRMTLDHCKRTKYRRRVSNVFVS